MQRRIYLAALFSRKNELADYADLLKQDGHGIASGWVYGDEAGLSREQIAVLDVDHVRTANTVVLFTMPRGVPQPGGGRFVEFGIAYERGAECLIVGEQENVFCCLPGIKQFNTFDEARAYLNGHS